MRRKVYAVLLDELQGKKFARRQKVVEYRCSAALLQSLAVATDYWRRWIDSIHSCLCWRSCRDLPPI